MKKWILITAILSLPWLFQAQTCQGSSQQDFSSYQPSTSYQGSSFQQVLKVISDANAPLKSKKELDEFAAYKSGQLPHYPVNAMTVFSSSPALLKDAQRTVSERHDYYDYLPKKLHANGVCLIGEWQVDQPSVYSGYFKQGSRGLFIGRASVTMNEIHRGSKRGFGFAEKIFPTLNESEIVKTANFFTVDVMLGTNTDRILETAMTNEPESGFNFSALGLGLRVASTLKKADENPSFRPVTPVAKLNESGSVKNPHWIRVSAARNLVKNDQIDFRSEILQAMKDNPELVFNIDVSDTVSDRKAEGWTRIGSIKIRKALVSYGCDRQLHFAHPRLVD